MGTEISLTKGDDWHLHLRDGEWMASVVAHSAHAAIELYAEVFEQAGALDMLEGFASFFGADFYRLPRSKERITLVKEPWTVLEAYPFGDSQLVPLRAGETVAWRLVD